MYRIVRGMPSFLWGVSLSSWAGWELRVQPFEELPDTFSHFSEDLHPTNRHQLWLSLQNILPPERASSSSCRSYLATLTWMATVPLD